MPSFCASMRQSLPLVLGWSRTWLRCFLSPRGNLNAGPAGSRVTSELQPLLELTVETRAPLGTAFGLHGVCKQISVSMKNTRREWMEIYLWGSIGVDIDGDLLWDRCSSGDVHLACSECEGDRRRIAVIPFQGERAVQEIARGSPNVLKGDFLQEK